MYKNTFSLKFRKIIKATWIENKLFKHITYEDSFQDIRFIKFTTLSIKNS